MRASNVALCAWLLSRTGIALAADPPPPSPAPTAVEPGVDMGAPAAVAPAAVNTAAPTSANADADAEGKFATAPGPVTDTFATDEASSDSDTQRKLDLYGFADFTYQRLLIDEKNLWNRTYPSVNSFAVGNFNLYLSSNLGDSWRALAEVRFMY